jgi:hypothetical protein
MRQTAEFLDSIQTSTVVTEATITTVRNELALLISEVEALKVTASESTSKLKTPVLEACVSIENSLQTAIATLNTVNGTLALLEYLKTSGLAVPGNLINLDETTCDQQYLDAVIKTLKRNLA